MCQVFFLHGFPADSTDVAQTISFGAVGLFQHLVLSAFSVCSSGPLEREDKSSSVGEANSALFVMGSLCLMNAAVVSSVCLCCCSLCHLQGAHTPSS